MWPASRLPAKGNYEMKTAICVSLLSASLALSLPVLPGDEAKEELMYKLRLRLSAESMVSCVYVSSCFKVDMLNIKETPLDLSNELLYDSLNPWLLCMDKLPNSKIKVGGGKTITELLSDCPKIEATEQKGNAEDAELSLDEIPDDLK